MANTRKSKKSEFLAGYSDVGSYLVKPDKKTGRPGLWIARDPQGRDVLIKFWPFDISTDDEDLAEIWRSEIRQLQRLAALPGGEELLVPMIGSGKDERGYYLVLDVGRGTPLATFLGSKNRYASLASPRQPRNRLRHWLNAKRLIQALELLHSQGFVHRNLDEWAVITEMADEVDFRLTGFEWSMRIAGIGEKISDKRLPSQAGVYASFARDWQQLGLLLCAVFSVNEKRVLDLSIVPSDVAENFTSAEALLLRTLLGLQSSERIDAEVVCGRIDAIVSVVRAELAGIDSKFCLSIRLGQGSQIAESIRSVCADVESSDEIDQRQFVLDDLSEDAFFVVVQEPDAVGPRYMLFGRQLSYRLRRLRLNNTQGEPTWEFAASDRADKTRPSPGFIKGSVPFDVANLDLQSSREATRSFARRRGRVASWQELITAAEPKQLSKTPRDLTHRSFALLLLLEMAYAVADVFPIEALPPTPDSVADRNNLVVTFRADKKRAELSEILKLKPPAVRLREALTVEGFLEETSWALSEAGILGDRTNDTEWRFTELTTDEGREALWFSGSAAQQVQGAGFLTPSGMLGRTRQFERRLKALKALKNQSELLGMLVDPRLRVQESQDPLEEGDEAFKAMDESKQKALREILATVPIFVLQGPPGVGKTYLVGELMRRRFAHDSATRVLLSAQSNSAIDHLMDEVQGVFSGAAVQPVMIRARAADDDAQEGSLELDKQADELLAKLSRSPLLSESSESLQNKMRLLLQSRQSGLPSRQANAEARAFQGMILRASNMVFATTNSSAVERLIDEGSLFDWTIVEEAGKATGGELLSPLLLSNRRLMIGDHKQLPAFGAEKVIPLLERTEDVRDALKICEELIARHLKDLSLEELIDEVEESPDFPAVCSRAIEIFQLFETFAERELERQRINSRRGMPIARRLTEQRRMHPAIAKIVSDCFYEGMLTTNAEKAREYLTSDPKVFGTFVGKTFKPISFVDLPYVRSNPKFAGGDIRPPYSNRSEADAVVNVISSLKTDGSKPSLAILSPYQRQVRLIRSRIDGPEYAAELERFTSPFGGREFCGTVDSFQGDEADVVIVSLVRNNSHSSPMKALGFLQDTRRMNVLLSRAKWMLILVGSLEFYGKIVEFAESMPDQDVGFMKKFLAAFDNAQTAGDAIVMPISQSSDRSRA